METPGQQQATNEGFDLEKYRFLLERLQQFKRNRERMAKKTAVNEPQNTQ
jgi:hypothetical protein